MRIACLHTAESNIEVFEAALRELGRDDVTLRHEVRADLLLAAERLGEVTDAIKEETQAVLLALCADADAVVLNCSTLGEVAEGLGHARVPVVRVDRALAEAAARAGGWIVVLCTAVTSIGPTTALFNEVAAGRRVEVRLVVDAWAMFRGGDRHGYFAVIAAAAEAAYAEGASVVALAQASMAGAARLVHGGDMPLTSPASALTAAIAAAGATPILARH